MSDPRIWPIPSVTDSFTEVGAVSTAVFAADLNRLGAELINDSTQVMYLGKGNPAVIGSGIRLNANGGSHSIGVDNLWQGTINAICADGQANLSWSLEYAP